MAVTLSEVKIAIHNSGEKGKRNAKSGISDFLWRAATNDTSL